MAVTILDIGYSNISLSLYLEAELIAGTGLKTYQFLKAEPYFFESIVLKSLRYLEEFSFEVVSVISIIIFSNSLISNSHCVAGVFTISKRQNNYSHPPESLC